MKTATIIRYLNSDHGTFGRLVCEDFNCFTLELPWRNNAHNISCIPAGEYICTWTFSNHFQRDLYLLNDVKDRSGVRIHSGNLAGDVEKGLKSHSNGCILLGERMGWLQMEDKTYQRAILVSKPTLEDFYEVTEKETIKLIIKEF